MFGHGKCPSCKQAISHCDATEVLVGAPPIGPQFRGVAICCPHCQTILGVTVEPIGLVMDIARQVKKELQG
jgi:hypothetical protein